MKVPYSHLQFQHRIHFVWEVHQAQTSVISLHIYRLLFEYWPLSGWRSVEWVTRIASYKPFNAPITERENGRLLQKTFVRVQGFAVAKGKEIIGSI